MKTMLKDMNEEKEYIYFKGKGYSWYVCHHFVSIDNNKELMLGSLYTNLVYVQGKTVREQSF